MGAKKINTAPVILFAFRRPEETKKVFEQIRKARPSKYFLYVDGPRNEEEKVKVDLVKKIASDVDWPCEFKTFFRPKNVGMDYCKEGISWFFKHVNEGILLEDDALPNQDFFRFCSELLEKYQKDNRIAYINGCNFLNKQSKTKDSYYFSRYSMPKGFAIWKRSLNIYRLEMEGYPEFKRANYLREMIEDPIERFVLNKILNEGYVSIGSNDIHWIFSLLTSNCLAITPNKNLVQDIGFGEGAANTKEIDSFYSKPLRSLSFPLKHPKFIIRNGLWDKKYFRWIFFKKLQKQILLRTKLYKLFSIRPR
jgi:hypothetical protein